MKFYKDNQLSFHRQTRSVSLVPLGLGLVSTAWNSLPDFIRDPTVSADCFRLLLKTYLFARY